MKRHIEKNSSPEMKVRMQKVCKRNVLLLFLLKKLNKLCQNDFIKSLNLNLRTLRKVEADKRQYDRGAVEDYSDDQGDDDYMSKRTKRRKPVMH